ncbi:MAG: hypothetical protein WCB01_09885 [Candidatus Cybelea sp.]
MQNGLKLRYWARRILAALVLAAIVWFAFGWLGAQTACAHDPRFSCSPRDAQHAVAIPDAQKSWAYYGRLARGQRDIYRVVLRDRLTVPLSVSIEKADAVNPGRPRVAVRDSSVRAIAIVPFDRVQAFYEPFSRISYLTTPNRELHLPSGTYSITVTIDRATLPQRYVLAVGSLERFTVGEIPYVIGAVHRIRTRGY